MSFQINIAQNILTQQLVGTLMGPVMIGQTYVEGLLTTMTTMEWKVANGSQLTHPLPYGVFANIENRHNMTQSYLVAHFAPGFFDTPSAPVFNEVCCKKQDIHEFICSATVCKKVVPIASNLETDSGGTVIWSCNIEPIDEVHGLMTTIKNPYLLEQEGSVWDEVLHQFIILKRLLTKTFAASSIGVVSTTMTYINYTPLKCGWWIKNTEVFSGFSLAYSTTINYDWPAVLKKLYVDIWPLVEGGAHEFGFPVYSKPHYSGPCKADVTESFEVGAPSVDIPTPMLPRSIQLNCPFYNITELPSLHGRGAITTYSGDDSPVWLPAYAIFDVPATTPTDWPDFVIDMTQVQPYKGGFIKKKYKVYPPVEDAQPTASNWSGVLPP